MLWWCMVVGMADVNAAVKLAEIIKYSISKMDEAPVSLILVLRPTDIEVCFPMTLAHMTYPSIYIYFFHFFTPLSRSEKLSLKLSRTGEFRTHVLPLKTLKTVHMKCQGKMREFSFWCSDSQPRSSFFSFQLRLMQLCHKLQYSL